MRHLVLLRHGESTGNRANRFAGWTDVDLTPRGEREAAEAGRLLREKGYGFDLAFTSVLERAIRTLQLVLDVLDLASIPVRRDWRLNERPCSLPKWRSLSRRDWRLNERHFGRLQGRGIAEAVAEHGLEQVTRWRRGQDRPPPLDEGDERHPRHDSRYAGLAARDLPVGESLQDAAARLLPLWHESIAPEIRAGRRVLVVAHGNVLRALNALLDALPDDALGGPNVPTGIPRVYELDDEMRPRRHGYLGDPETVRRAIEAASCQDPPPA
jgi:2,3-bisphosphoglycerate-dependent phosphoglycerate mutase